ncbi:MAG: tRNA (guanine(10)-N(2))-dimethyltransferase, partial [Candidatus Bathyarchaeota archaeon]|nr:tRNA (guanine(10)-N(2))-dimethyltransferase [Candidatus Bathyarchaeota archaeon]
EGPVTHYVVDKICDKFGLLVPPFRDVIDKIRESGFKALPTHFNSTGFKTDAPAVVVTAIVKEVSQASLGR